ncbi:hypothetical protein Vretimale_751 [Volvox reticuliferus]|uniref:Uncharacterized protein n=1 Tax=Volvox reticuliferus TaxID=1737510 RepID=A0A8J4BYH9_9CHLO|nr:hypothetical protein Vretifemale_2281 [Volvox reticuliferus]GIL94522.1 hypothetical protein Vretimale_751 [Volvox reticuliferus]
MGCSNIKWIISLVAGLWLSFSIAVTLALRIAARFFKKIYQWIYDVIQAEPSSLRVFFYDERKVIAPSLPTLKLTQDAKISGRKYGQNTDEEAGPKVLQTNRYRSHGVRSSTGGGASNDAKAGDINGAGSSDGAINGDRTGSSTQTPPRVVRLKCWDELLRSEAEAWEWRYKMGSPRMLIHPEEVVPSPKQVTVASSPEAPWHGVQLRRVEGLPGPSYRYE